VSAPQDFATSPGLSLIAAYRAARLDQRSTFHAGPPEGGAPPDASETAEPAPADEAIDQPVVPEDSGAPLPRTLHRPLAESGFGAGMVIRLGQLGLHTTGDLAQADVAQLRAALGDISRLVDVEGWIHNARRECGIGGL